mgnify:CR=1 FL=1
MIPLQAGKIVNQGEVCIKLENEWGLSREEYPEIQLPPYVPLCLCPFSSRLLEPLLALTRVQPHLEFTYALVFGQHFVDFQSLQNLLGLIEADLLQPNAGLG